MLRRKVVVIRNGCDVSAFPGAGAPDVNDCFRFAVVGTVYKVKNPIVVVEAVSILKSRINVGFRVDWYGRFGLNGDSEPSADCVAAIRLMETLGVGESITFHGETRPIAPKLREVSAFLHASRQEGFPNAVIEAMLSGLPLVVSRVSDLPLVVQEARNGFCFDETDAGALADAMQHMIETPISQRLAMGARSRELAVRWFGLARFVDEYENLYSGLLEPRT